MWCILIRLSGVKHLFLKRTILFGGIIIVLFHRCRENLIGDERFSHYIIPEDSIYLLVPNVLKDGKINVLARFMELKEHYGLVDYE